MGPVHLHLEALDDRVNPSTVEGTLSEPPSIDPEIDSSLVTIDDGETVTQEEVSETTTYLVDLTLSEDPYSDPYGDEPVPNDTLTEEEWWALLEEWMIASEAAGDPPPPGYDTWDDWWLAMYLSDPYGG